MKKLQDLKWKPLWVTHMGCLVASKDYLGAQLSDAAIYGATGHAFVINIHDELCPSGPTAWKSLMLFENIKNLGLQIEGFFGWQGEDLEKFHQLQKDSWDYLRKCMDENLPCYGWYMDEYFLFDGYDDTGYFLKGPGHEEGLDPIAWEDLGKAGVTFLEVYSVRKTQEDAISPEMILRKAFESTLNHANNLEGWIFDSYRSGFEAFDWWIKALEQGKAGQFGNSYNAQVWSECRRYAVEFLDEYQFKVHGEHRSLVEDALAHYRVVAENLSKVAALYPFGGFKEDEYCRVDTTSSVAVEALRKASTAEAKALAVLEKFVAL